MTDQEGPGVASPLPAPPLAPPTNLGAFLPGATVQFHPGEAVVFSPRAAPPASRASHAQFRGSPFT